MNEYTSMYLDDDSDDKDIEKCTSKVKEMFYWEWLSYARQYDDPDFDSIEAMNRYQAV